MGRIVQQAPGVDYPADSFFDVFFDISLDGGTTWQPVDQPLRMEAVIQAIPPILAYYRSPQPVAIPVIGPGGQVIAVIRYALHIPLPPREIVIIFVNYRPPTPTPTATPTMTLTRDAHGHRNADAARHGNTHCNTGQRAHTPPPRRPTGHGYPNGNSNRHADPTPQRRPPTRQRTRPRPPRPIGRRLPQPLPQAPPPSRC